MKSNVPVNNVLVSGYNGACFGFNPDGTVNDNICDDGEQILDIVNVIGMAPGIDQVLFYEGSSATEILNQMASDNVAKVISNSWGGGDFGLASDPSFLEFQAQGQTFVSATGDYGSFLNGHYLPPAVHPNITQVGGTDLTTNGAGGSWSSEAAWSGSGGGYVNSTAIPNYQQLLGVVNGGNAASATLRNSPDVAAEADFDNTTVIDGVFESGFGGTSYATPRWAGLIALANQQSVANDNETIGFLNPILYDIGVGASYLSDLHDILSGNKADGGAGYSSVFGYDLVTGWGSPNGAALIETLASYSSHNPSFTLSATPASVSSFVGGAGTATITIAVFGGFSSAVSLAVSDLPTGVTWASNPSTISGEVPSLTLTFTVGATVAAGTYTITVTGTGGGRSASVNIELAIFRLPTSISLTSSSSQTLCGQGVTLTAAVSPEPSTGSVTFLDGVNILGTSSVSGGSASLNTSFLLPGSHSLKAVYSMDHTCGFFNPKVIPERFRQVWARCQRTKTLSNFVNRNVRIVILCHQFPRHCPALPSPCALACDGLQRPNASPICPDACASPSRFQVHPRLATLLGAGYHSSEQAIQELADNAWDADADHVWIALPFPVSSDPMVLKDDGSGMIEQEVRKEYLKIARDRRAIKGNSTPRLHRPVKGRNGIGKFAGLVIAGIMQIDTRAKSQSTRLTILKEDLQTGSELEALPLQIDVVPCESDERGTTVRLSSLDQHLNYPTAERLKELLVLEYGREQGFEIFVNEELVGIEHVRGTPSISEELLPMTGPVRLRLRITEDRQPARLAGIALRVGGKIIAFLFRP